MKYIIITMLLLASCQSRVNESIRLVSDQLEAEIQVYIREVGQKAANKPIVYLTDGDGFLDQKIDVFLDSLTMEGLIPAAYYVFVSSINERTGVNERNRFFFCNESYRNFFTTDLIPRVEERIGQAFDRSQRSLLGISFGALNTAYFATAGEHFSNYALLSPITYPCEGLHAAIAFSTAEDLRIFISTGKNDAEAYANPLAAMFRSQNHQVKYHVTEGGHDFDNWKSQLVTALNFLMPRP